MSNPLKKTMVFLGLAEEDLQQQPASSTEQVTEAQPTLPKKAEKPAPVTPLRKITPSRQAAAQPVSEILTVHPERYSDARVIAETFRDDVPVILNVSRLTDADAKRIIDFSSGLVMGLGGQIERVTGKVFLLAPAHIAAKSQDDLSEEDPETHESGSFFVSAVAQ